MAKDDNNWLQNLKPGDSVIVSPGATYTPDYVAMVTRTTATQIHIGNVKFRRTNGREVGGDRWHSADLREPTPDALAAVRLREHKARLLSKFRETRWGRLPLSVLEEIERMVDGSMPTAAKEER